MGVVQRSGVVAVLAMAVGVTTEGVFVASPRPAYAAPLGVEEPNAAAEAATRPLAVGPEAPESAAVGLSPEVLADPAFTGPSAPGNVPDQAPPAPVGDLSGPVEPDSEFRRALAEARSSGGPVELATRTTETTISRVHPDGMVHVESTAGPVRTRVGGEWVDVDTTLVAAADGVRPVAVTGEITFSAGGNAAMATLGDGEGTELRLEWPGELPDPVLAGATATVVTGQGKGLHPRGQVAGQRHDRAPDLVQGEVVQRQVGQPAVLRGSDTVLAAGPAAVPQLQVSQLPAGAGGDECGDPMPVDVGDPQLRARVRAFLAHDQPHPGRPRGEIEQGGDLGDPRTGAELAVGGVGRLP